MIQQVAAWISDSAFCEITLILVVTIIVVITSAPKPNE